MENSQDRMTPAELAALLNGREYGSEISRFEADQAKIAGLVVVYGYSDDNMKFKGAIDDEIGCYGGGTAYLTGSGILQNDCDVEVCPYFANVKDSAATIKAVWCAESTSYAWTYETAIPHETFATFELGEPLCRGIVFALSDVGRISDDANREAFEVFIRAEPFYAHFDEDGLCVEIDPADGGYLDSCVHGAWLAWNARGAK